MLSLVLECNLEIVIVFTVSLARPNLPVEQTTCKVSPPGFRIYSGLNPRGLQTQPVRGIF